MSEVQTTTHDTDYTVAQINKHLGFLSPTTNVRPAADHDSLRDGDPVAAVEIGRLARGYLFEVYPVEGTAIVGIAKRTIPVTRWAIDIVVVDEDPDTGICGSETIPHVLCNDFAECLQQLGKCLAHDQIRQSMEAEEYLAECQAKYAI